MAAGVATCGGGVEAGGKGRGLERMKGKMSDPVFVVAVHVRWGAIQGGNGKSPRWGCHNA